MRVRDDTPTITGHMTLNPVIHMGWPSLIFLCLAGISWGQMPVNPANFRTEKWSNIIVSAAGPFLNLCLAFLSILMIKGTVYTSLGNIFSPEFFLLAARLNVVLFLFNLLPIPPLDGFHVFSELFPSLKPLRNSPFGLAAFMILFISGAFSLLFELADIMIGNLI